MVAISHKLLSKVALLTLLSSTVLAAPIAVVEADDSPADSGEPSDDLQTRAPGDSASQPIQANFNIDGWEDIAEENCRVMLCILGGNRVFQRVVTAHEGDVNYTGSGASVHPFYAANLSDRGTAQINPSTTSAEDFPWRSIHLPDGARRYVMPATDAQQRSQGGSINGGYLSSQVGYNEWFEINFQGNLGPHCRALHQNPPDTSVCSKNVKETLFGTRNIDLRNIVYYKVQQGNKIGFAHEKSI
ncbi:hypothetical protein AMS68_007814 [Peltaster fructicola]|uniref:Uncharacterized protein n=1 Tax=Peltaster fructicola TaxID=286661 RepID=A0A6H0Y5H1_9PEZI|nr:hypothetical protein AMS68_007814 [Peltaster fructicola]